MTGSGCALVWYIFARLVANSTVVYKSLYLAYTGHRFSACNAVDGLTRFDCAVLSILQYYRLNFRVDQRISRRNKFILNHNIIILNHEDYNRSQDSLDHVNNKYSMNYSSECERITYIEKGDFETHIGWQLEGVLRVIVVGWL